MSQILNPVTILIVEDDEVDMMSIRRELRALRLANPKIHAKDGAQALSYMRGSDGYTKIENECIIFLDLNMPRVSGIEFLEVLNSEQDLPPYSVFILTTSEADTDIVKAYKNNIQGYILKSHLKEGISQALASAKSEYWTVFGALK